MKLSMFVLLMFVTTLTLFAGPPRLAPDVGIYKTATKEKGNAIVVPPVATLMVCDNAAFSLVTLFNPEGAPAEVGTLTKPPTVEVKAKATVAAPKGSYCYQRVKFASNTLISRYSKCQPRINLHIDPGLRGC